MAQPVYLSTALAHRYSLGTDEQHRVLTQACNPLFLHEPSRIETKALDGAGEGSRHADGGKVGGRRRTLTVVIVPAHGRVL